MATPEVFDVDSLLQPIRPDRPGGDDLREDASPNSLYYRIKDVRTQARAAERQAQMTGDDEGFIDWSPIISDVPAALVAQSKDLELSAYFIEALAREYGFAGLRDGFRLVKGLVEEFHENIYPEPDEDGVETTLAPLTGLNGDGADGTLIGPIGAIPLTDSATHGKFSQQDYLQAQELERMSADAQKRRLDQGGIDVATFQLAVGETSAEFYATLHGDIEEALTAFTELTAVLDEKYGRDSPPASSIRQAIETSKETIESVARDKLESLQMAAEIEEEAEESEQGGGSSGGSQAQSGVGKLENREDAFREILKISQYFRRTEPHSPISYALEQIVRWGRLPLPDLLKEMIDDESSISQMFRLVGIRKEGEEQP